MDYTLCITSCGRHDLLRQTLDSLVIDGPHVPRETFILEDGPAERPDWLPERYQWLSNDTRIGQIKSVDRLYALVQTPFIFHLEDDWTFNEPFRDFLPDSFSILQAFPEVFMVGLRGPAWNHPLVSRTGYHFKIAEPRWKGVWGGSCFNPGLRRRSDYTKPYIEITPQLMGCESEARLSKHHLEQGFVIADLGRPIVTHTGHNRSRAYDRVPIYSPLDQAIVT